MSSLHLIKVSAAAALLVCLGVSSAQATENPSWTEVQQSAGWETHASKQDGDAGAVEVYKRTVGGIPCFLGVARTDVGAEALLQVAKDILGTPRWSSAGVAEAEILGTDGAQLDYYQYLDVPGWTLAKDRFWFLRGTEERRDAGVIAFSWIRAWDNGGPYQARHAQVLSEHPDAIEPPVNVGGWVFTPADGQTEIRYFVCSDTGGAIPQSVQNLATTRTLPQTMGDLVREGRRISR